MSIKYEKIKVGQVLYDRHRYTMGNTCMKCLGEWPVEILELTSSQTPGYASLGATVKWNHNPPQHYNQRQLEKLYTWSIYDEGVERKKNYLGAVISVKRIKQTKESSNA